MGGQFGHRGPSGRLRQHLHGGVDVGNARLVLPRAAQRVSAVYHCLATLYAAYGATVEHIAEVEPGPGGRRRNAVAAAVALRQGHTVESPGADEVDYRSELDGQNPDKGKHHYNHKDAYGQCLPEAVYLERVYFLKFVHF